MCCIAAVNILVFCQVLSCLYGMDIRDAELASLERKRGGKAKKRKKKAEDDVATSFKEANAGALQPLRCVSLLILQAVCPLLALSTGAVPAQTVC